MVKPVPTRLCKIFKGQVILTLYGFYEAWGILQLLALEPVGDAIPEDQQSNQTLCAKMKVSNTFIMAGFVHGDIARRNFCRTEAGDVFLVDSEKCRPPEDPYELGDEMNEVDRLYVGSTSDCHLHRTSCLNIFRVEVSFMTS